MQLTDVQKESIKRWAAEGLGLSDLQKKISQELGVVMTYMDVRVLAIDLGLEIKEKPSSGPTPPLPPPPPAGEEDVPDFGEGPGPQGTGALSSVTVEVDRIMKPGSLVSGTVKFSDGVTGAWTLDQFGRLGLTTSKAGYRPGAADVQAFQDELRKILERQGF